MRGGGKRERRSQQTKRRKEGVGAGTGADTGADIDVDADASAEARTDTDNEAKTEQELGEVRDECEGDKDKPKAKRGVVSEDKGSDSEEDGEDEVKMATRGPTAKRKEAEQGKPMEKGKGKGTRAPVNDVSEESDGGEAGESESEGGPALKRVKKAITTPNTPVKPRPRPKVRLPPGTRDRPEESEGDSWKGYRRKANKVGGGNEGNTGGKRKSCVTTDHEPTWRKRTKSAAAAAV
ncbi:hypothetical protein RSOLAG22IIIB_13807 [Rhizoctonia solani]|uniref:Uncharacterized protein n=1 Tax=Rhizoctonia solani TaxID=456999 RepID=A0A0K6FR85_9AGAM|nr:hypothetical protein RSOLAG22IIIB_13807 [Rhizoctonia solani]